MAIQLQDINPSDTIQGMVQKINYNFDQIQANGGGPQGIQGEQGDRGETGPRGAQGEQGQRGSMWFVTDGGSYTAPDGYDPTENDICISSEGEISIYGDNGWQDTGVNIVANIDSPFVTNESNNVKRIQARSDYGEYILGLGNNVNTIEQITTKPSIAICVNTEQNATSHTDGIEMYDSLFDPQTYIGGLKGNGTGIRLESNGEIKLTAGGTGDLSTTSHSLILSETGKTMTWTALENVAPVTATSTEFPFIVAKSNGEITPYNSGAISNKYGWSILSYSILGNILFTSIAPNRESGYTGFHIGHPARRIDTIYTGNENAGGLIVGHQPNDDKYGIMIANTRNSLTGSGVNSVGIHKDGITVGNVSSSISADGKNNMMKGISILDNDTYGGCISFGISELPENEYIGSILKTVLITPIPPSSANITPGNEALISVTTMPIYKTNLTKGSQYGKGSLITINQKNTDSSSRNNKSQLKIIGANGAYGGSVVISGGRAYTGTGTIYNTYTYTPTAVTAKRGGDVYISGGDAVTINPENNPSTYPNEFKMRPKCFGDVIIGINPDNHSMYYTNNVGNNISSYRGVNTHTGEQSLDFYDINNFIAHANRITLDSNAQDMCFNPNLYNEAKYPSADSLVSITFNIGGLCTLNHSVPIAIPNDRRINMYQMLSGKMCYGYEVRVDANNNVSKTTLRGKNININKNSIYSIITTEWTKIGNVIQCCTKISNYYTDTNKYIYVLSIDNYASSTAFYSIFHDNVSCIIPIRLPIYIEGQQQVNSINGTGVAMTEQKGTLNSSGSYVSSRFVNPDLPANCIIDGIHTDIGFGFVNQRHDGSGKITSTDYPLGAIVTGHRYPEDYCNGKFQHDTNGENWFWLGNENTLGESPIIVPDTLYAPDGGGDSATRTMRPLHKLYTTGTFNYTYILNPSFTEEVYSPFSYNWIYNNNDDAEFGRD